MSDEPHNRKRKVRRGEDVSEREHAEETLQTTLQRLYALVSSMHGSVLLVAEDRVELANQTFCDYFGLKNAPADLVGLTAAQMIQRIKNAYLDPDKQTRRIAEIVRRGKPVMGEEIAMRDGRVCLRDFVPISVDGTSHGRLWYHVDITERKQAEKALSESESMLRAVLEQIPSGVTIRDARTGDLILSNSRSREIMGKLVDVPGEFGRYRGLHPDGHPYQTEEWPVSRSMATGEVVDAEEIPCERSDGTRITLSMSSAPVRDPQGQIIIGVGVFSDITEHRRAEEALHKSEQRYRTLLESAPDAILVHRNGEVLYANPVAVALYGASSLEELAQHNIVDLVPPSEARVATERTRRVQSGRKLPIREGRIVRLDGREVPIEVVSSPVEFGGGTAAQAIIRDITDRKRAQAEIESLARFPGENPNPVLRISRYGVLMYANQASRAWLEDWGCAVGEMAPETLRAFVDKAFAKRRPKPITVDIGLVGLIWSLQVIPITGAGYANIYARDITERRRAEDALRFQAHLLESAQDAVIATDAQDNVTFWNRTAEKLFGWTANEALGRPRTEVAGHTSGDAETIWTHVQSGKAWSGEHHHQRRDGTVFAASCTISPILNQSGQVAGALSVILDITERKRVEEALRESEADLARAQAVGHIGSWRLDVQRNTLNWSAESYRMFGISPGTSLTYEGFLACVHPEDREAVDRAWQAALSGKPYSIDHRSIVGGDVRWIHEQAELEFDKNGGLLGGFGTCQDITERRRAEVSLRESQQRLSTIVDSIADGFYALDREWRFTHMNDAAERYFGIKSKAAMGRAIFDVFPGFRGSVFETEFRWAMESGEPVHVETPSVVTNRIVEIHAYPGLESITVIFRDVTERKKAQDELRLQANALQAAANGIVITDPNGTIQWVNGAFTRLTGYSFEEATGQNPRVLKSGQHDKTFYDKLWKTILAGRVWQGEIVNKRKDGRLYAEEMTITPVRDDAGQTAHFIAIKQDVSERKRLEAELERTRTEFLGEVSHELKTPLTAIKGCAAMALSSPIPPDAAETRELFDIIDAQANRLTDLVANLLDVTRIEGRRLSIEPTATDLAGIVEESRVIFEHSQYPHPLEVMLPRQLPMLRADARRVVQVLTNLFTNAAKYSAPTTPIIVTAEKGEGVVTVHVRDAGVGIAAEKMPLLFRKFVQVQERGVKGTGLGLFICKGIVEAHGGRIWAESDGKGKGTVFSFTLPAVAGKMAPKHKGAAAGSGGVGRNAAERPFRIVAVDDEPDILHYIEHCLRSANCEVVSTSDPLAAAELVRFHTPDIVLLDMRMPGMSGLDVLEEIRKFCQTPVTFITATQNREDVVRGREFGGTTWLEKPFSPQQLLDHVGLVLARRRRR